MLEERPVDRVHQQIKTNSPHLIFFFVQRIVGLNRDQTSAFTAIEIGELETVTDTVGARPTPSEAYTAYPEETSTSTAIPTALHGM